MIKKEKAKGFVGEFKAFIAKGPVLDLAVAVVLGAAFGNIITSLVNDVIMPVVGMIIGGIDFTSLVVKVGSAEIKYGLFIQNVVNFLIIAFCIFVFVKAISKVSRRKKEEPKPPKPADIALLEEIRDLLKKDK